MGVNEFDLLPPANLPANRTSLCRPVDSAAGPERLRQIDQWSVSRPFSPKRDDAGGRPRIGAGEITTAPMSLAKGLEFRAVVVMACDEGVLPLDERVADAAPRRNSTISTIALRRLHASARASAAHGRSPDIRVSGGLHLRSGLMGSRGATLFCGKLPATRPLE